MTDKYTHSILKERADYAVLVRELPSTVQTLFALEWRRVEPPRSCCLMDCEIVEPTITPQEALATGQTWGISLALKFEVFEQGEKATAYHSSIGPFPKLTSDDTYIFDGLEWAPDERADSDLSVASSLKYELMDATHHATKNLKYWLPRLKTRNDNPSPQVSQLLASFFYTKESLKFIRFV